MCRMLAFTLAMTLAVLTPTVAQAAKDIHDWENVVKLKLNTPVMILLWNGDRIAGHLVAADNDRLLVDSHGRRSSILVADRSVDRASVEWVVKISEGRFPDAEKWMLAGTLGGAAAGVVLTVVRDSREAADGAWILGGLGGAALGFFASSAAVAGVAIGGNLPAIFHHRKVVYEGQRSPPVPIK
jgi:hypothetical protein